MNSHRLVGLAVLAAAMTAASGDPLVAAVSLTLLVGFVCTNRWPRTAGPALVSSVQAQGSGRVKNLTPVDHDCPVALSVIRR